MSISKLVQTVLKAVSKKAPDVFTNYKASRAITELSHPPLANPLLYKDIFLNREGYEIPIRMFSQPFEHPKHVMVYLHGGGWVTGGIDSYTTLCSRLAKSAKSLVFLVDYRLAPEFTFPTGLEDCYFAISEASACLPELGIKESIIVIGDSAGGNLAAAVSLLARDLSEFEISKQILIYPSLSNDHTQNSPYPSIVENGFDYGLTAKNIQDYLALYAGKNESCKNNPYFAPLVSQDLTRLPSALVITSQFCALRDEGIDYANKLKAAGVRTKLFTMEDTIHGYFNSAVMLPSVTATYEIINNFINTEEA